MRHNLILLLLCLLFGSCSETSLVIEESDLVGVWRSENTHINGLPASLFINGGEFYSSILGLKENNSYYLNYSSGVWTVANNKLLLSNQGMYTITSFTDNLITIKSKIMAGQLYWQLEGISKDEIITYAETFRRE